jgi:hypothetical protein
VLGGGFEKNKLFQLFPLFFLNPIFLACHQSLLIDHQVCLKIQNFNNVEKINQNYIRVLQMGQKFSIIHGGRQFLKWGLLFPTP